jgi:hypothetical protein
MDSVTPAVTVDELWHLTFRTTITFSQIYNSITLKPPLNLGPSWTLMMASPVLGGPRVKPSTIGVTTLLSKFEHYPTILNFFGVAPTPYIRTTGKGLETSISTRDTRDRPVLVQ